MFSMHSVPTLNSFEYFHWEIACSLLTKALEHHDSVTSFAWMPHQLLTSAPDHNLSVSVSGLQESQHSVTELMLSTLLCCTLMTGTTMTGASCSQCSTVDRLECNKHQSLLQSSLSATLHPLYLCTSPLASAKNRIHSQCSMLDSHTAQQHPQADAQHPCNHLFITIAQLAAQRLRP